MARKRGLNAAQEHFAKTFVETGNASEAYRKAYPTSQKWSANAVNVEARRCQAHPVISLRIEEIRAAIMAETEITLSEHLRELAEIRDLAKADGRYSAAVSAETSRGKVCGFYSDKVEVKTELSGEIGVKAKLPDSILEMIEANKKRVYADMLERKKGQQKAK